MAAGVVLGTSGTLPVAAWAQSNGFTALKYVNELAVTKFEYDQRLLFLQILRQQGDLEKIALDGLISERLQTYAADQLDVSVSPEAVTAGMEEFAARANLPVEEFLKIVNEMGLETESYRDFVEAGVLWREVVRAKYGASTQVSDAEIDRALRNFVPTTSLRAKFSEIVIPATASDRSNGLAYARRLKQELANGAEFGDLARKNSSGPTASRGGVRDWTRLSDVDPEVAAKLRALAPGAVSDPIVTPDAIVLYQMTEVAEDKLSTATPTQVEFAQFLIPNDASVTAEVARVRAAVDTCDDLYSVAKSLPAERLTRETLSQSAIPSDISAALTLLDPGESNATLTRGRWRVFLMLCSRGPGVAFQPSREEMMIRLANQHLATQAEIYLEELRTEAIFRDP